MITSPSAARQNKETKILSFCPSICISSSLLLKIILAIILFIYKLTKLLLSFVIHLEHLLMITLDTILFLFIYFCPLITNWTQYVVSDRKRNYWYFQILSQILLIPKLKTQIPFFIYD